MASQERAVPTNIPNGAGNTKDMVIGQKAVAEETNAGITIQSCVRTAWNLMLVSTQNAKSIILKVPEDINQEINIQMHSINQVTHSTTQGTHLINQVINRDNQ